MKSPSSNKRCQQAAAEHSCLHIPPPAEIVGNILCNLPVKSLLRFRCVSTSWQSLISSNLFAREHHSAQTDNIFKKVLISSNPMIINNNYLDRLPLTSQENMPKSNAEYLASIHPGKHPTYRPWRFLASCNGLICMEPEYSKYYDYHHDRSLYVWNPSMKIHREIPSSCYTYDSSSVGFGYDAMMDDYKIMKLKGIYAEIYSLKTESWIRVADFPGIEYKAKSYPYCTQSVFVDGAIHWLDLDRQSTIFSFDISENDCKFIEVPLPEYQLMPCHPRQVSLCELKGMLCVLVNGGEGLILWAKKDYRDGQESWTRVLAISFSRVVSCNFSSSYIVKPLYLYDNGEVLIGGGQGGSTHQTMTQLLICKDNQIVHRQITCHDPLMFRDEKHGLFLVESLISP